MTVYVQENSVYVMKLKSCLLIIINDSREANQGTLVLSSSSCAL